jgi:nucleoside-diphosphate-sugar epimerase
VKAILVFGINGRTGVAVKSVAQEYGLEVRGFKKRNPSIDELREAVRGADGVVIVFGPRPPYTDIFCADMTKRILMAMEADKVKRLICQTGAMIGNYPHNRSIIFELFSNWFRKSNPFGHQDRVQQEEIVINSSLEWTIVKPPRLTEGALQKTFQAGENVKVGLLSSISRKTLAQFLVHELLNPHFVRKVVFAKG